MRAAVCKTRRLNQKNQSLKYRRHCVEPVTSSEHTNATATGENEKFGQSRLSGIPCPINKDASRKNANRKTNRLSPKTREASNVRMQPRPEEQKSLVIWPMRLSGTPYAKNKGASRKNTNRKTKRLMRKRTHARTRTQGGACVHAHTHARTHPRTHTSTHTAVTQAERRGGASPQECLA